ncbi:DUF2125 domain-containing protein [Lutimaribacter sp. EGI FJ00015]|uniref:DUF2125 domain-containing protein n=1 Tax=Lutimaribacter degradans TaxID=2945989 RepID=A0ACC5ZWI2_9RHOB|nr:DUF2125 domain-containing protein [Lutimaribacter sp. EGI FJ00013]MCM2561764.1 DUF2125 domain-containing protein [Lutimaribacter sp. EGI FJ00013]MCO0613204.1 DUF2125 domain-containing protein [Lutimaribacter sp. EGI FJ00015]MCO0635596.1 DUF2125 domain-containing protein [Lutimaribacter sp. EGI FJ00014]
MTFARAIGGAGVALGVLAGTPAWAEVSPEQVWDDFKGYLQGFGYSITADEAPGAGALVVSDITVTMEMPEEGGTASFDLPDMTFTDAGGGTVTMTLPVQSSIPFMVDVEGDDDMSGEMELTHTGFLMTVSGEPGDLVYDYEAGDITVGLSSLTVEQEEMDITAARTTLRNMEGQSTIKVGELRNVVQSMNASVMEYAIDMTDPDDGTGRLMFNGQADDLTFDGTMSLPLEEIESEDPNAMIEAGFEVNGGYTHAGGQSNFSFDDDGTSVTGTTRSGSGAFTVRMGADQLGYDVVAKDVAVNVTSSDMPFPVEIEMAESAMSFKMPVLPGEEPQDFALGLTLADFTMSDMIWSMFDPAGQLPRDPATVAVDLSGTARLDGPLLDSDTMESSEAPGELRTLDIGNLVLRLAGAELTGQGGFTFDNSDTSTFDGVPRPEGSVDLRLEGGNTLLDRLVNMGLLPEEQATGARMMIGLFAVPGDGDDVLTSTIEVNEAGQVLANGQRLR